MFDTFKTLTGLTLAEALVKLDEELPPDAYSKVPGAVELTDIDPGYMRQVLNTVFGPCGLGWGYHFTPDCLALTLGEKSALAVIKSMTVWYKLADSETVQTFEIQSTGASDNRTPQYAMKGAITSALGNAVSNLGFQESVYLGHRSHATVGKKNGATKPPMLAVTTPAASPKVETPKTEPKNGNGATAAADTGEFVVNIGTTHKGKRVADLPAQALVWFAEKMAATTSDAQATKDACARFLAAHPELRPNGNGVKAPVPA